MIRRLLRFAALAELLSFVTFLLVGCAVFEAPAPSDQIAPQVAAPATVQVPSPQERFNAQVIRLYEENDCWNADSPSKLAPGEYPTHVLISQPGAATPRLAGPRRVEQALEQIFEGADYGFTIHAFCR